jgi:hypothetical protein
MKPENPLISRDPPKIHGFLLSLSKGVGPNDHDISGPINSRRRCEFSKPDLPGILFDGRDLFKPPKVN